MLPPTRRTRAGRLFAGLLVMAMVTGLAPTQASGQAWEEPPTPVPVTWPDENPVPPPEPVIPPAAEPPPAVARPALHKTVKPRKKPPVRRAARRGPGGGGDTGATYVAARAGANWRPSWWPAHLPAGNGRAAVLVSVSRNRAYVHDGKRLWTHFPVATGKDFATPRGAFRVVNKTLSPSWTYKDKHVAGGAWGNPLGVAWLGLGMPAGWGRYPIGLHGTNAPWSIGYRVSKGCIRMRNSDILTVYRHVPVGSPVWIVW